MTRDNESQAYKDLDDNGNGVLDKDDFSHNVGLWAEIKSKLDDDHSGEIDNNEWTTGLTRVAMELSAGEISKHFKGRQVFTKRPLNILEFYKELEVASNVALHTDGSGSQSPISPVPAYPAMHVHSTPPPTLSTHCACASHIP